MELKNLMEAVVFAAGRTVAVGEVLSLVEATETGLQVTRKEIEQAFGELVQEWQERGRGFTLEEVAGGYEFRSRPEYAPMLAVLNQSRPQRLSTPAIESLAVIAYRQPVTRGELESLRGVDCAGVLKSLSERNLIRAIGRKEEPGRPLLYGTTHDFLELFGLKDLGELPPLKEFEEKIREHQEVAPLTIADLTTAPEEFEALDGEDQKALDDLETSLAELKAVEKKMVPEEIKEEQAV